MAFVRGAFLRSPSRIEDPDVLVHIQFAVSDAFAVRKDARREASPGRHAGEWGRLASAVHPNQGGQQRRFDRSGRIEERTVLGHAKLSSARPGDGCLSVQ